MFGRLLLVLSAMRIAYEISSVLLKRRSLEFSSEDRISMLPDDLLVKILSRLSTKDAIATMILSKRWKCLWTMVPILWYKEENDEKQQRFWWFNKKKKQSLWRFIDESLQLHKAPVLERFIIELGRSTCPVPIDVDVGKWIANAVARKVYELTLIITWSAEPARLCKSLYTCDTLVNLYLCDKILVDVPSSFCLPSLKTLGISRVVYKDEDSLVRLLSNCPVLKFLGVDRYEHDNLKTFNIKKPSLEYLLYVNRIKGSRGSLVIDSPALKKIYFSDCATESCSIENKFCLDSAYIYVDFNPDDKFMTSLSSVIHLNLGLSVKPATCCNAINFSQLIKCHIYLVQEFDWLEALMGLLQNSPNLKLLFIDQSHLQFKDDFPLSWNQPSSVPKCLSSHLEIIQWNEYIGRNKEKEVIRYIFTNSKCLQKAVISMKSTCKIKKEEEMKDLESMFRISRSSQLLFSNQFEFPSVEEEMREYLNSV